MNRDVLRAAAPAILVAALVLGSQLGRAFTIDDTFFLNGALHASGDPFHPTAYDIAWEDAPERVSVMGGAVMAWLLVPAVLSSSPEVVAHLMELGLFAMAILATVELALRLGVHHHWAGAAGLLLATAPTALAMAGTAMADVPAMALGIVGLERLVAWRSERRLHQAVVATLALALGPLARPHSILFLGVGALLLVDDLFAPAKSLRSGWARWIPLPAALLVTCVLLAMIWDHAPNAPGLTGTIRRLSAARSLASNAVAYPIHWVLAMPLALPWLLLRPVPVLRRWWLILPATAGFYALQLPSGRPSPAMAVAAALGTAVLWDILADALARRDGTKLALGLWLFMPLAALPYSHLPAKFLLSAAPAATILVARQLAAAGAWRARLSLGGTVVLGLTLGTAILRADAAFGDLGRRAVAQLVVPQIQSGTRVWFRGHWGFQWYAERAGARPVTITPPFPEPGDMIITSRNSGKGLKIGRTIMTEFRLSLIARVEESSPGGRVMAEGAGFYSNPYGFLPWTWGDQPLDSIALWRVDAHLASDRFRP